MIYLLAIISIVSAVSPFGQISGSYTEVSRSKKGNVETVQWQYTKPGEYYEKPTSPAHSQIKLEVTQDSTYEITFKIINSQDTFEIPHEFPFPYNKESTSTPKYNYFLNSQGSVFRLERLDGTVLFDLKSTDVLSLLYHELHVSKESSYIWGLGERRIDTYKLQNGEYTIWTFDNGALETKTKGGQMYGHHPVFLQNIKSKYHITFLRSSRPMTVQLTDNELIYRITGGQIEFKFFIGSDDARDVIKQYHRYINGWALHPFWSSGWHQSRWGYKNISVLRGVVEGYKTNNIPLDTLWTDLDYMQDRKDFTLDQVNFPKLEMQKLIDLTKPDGVNWVPIIDPGVAVKSQCGDRLVQSGAYIRSNKQNKTPLKGSVWPGDVYFPDFNHQGAFQLWHQCQLDFQTEYGIIPRGIWIDMNELANFVDGEIGDTKTKLNPNIFELNDLPFDAAGKGTLEGHTISIDGLHTGGRFFKGTDIPELDLHSFNGFMESIITQESQAVIQKSNLTFILTRASIFGSGRFVQHWFGDNGATWTWFKNSIAAMFNFNLFGIPFSGDDICGFNGDSNAQLCARWIQLGVFYPFSRNHNSIDNKDQEPYVFTKYVIEAAQKSISLRYSLLKYHYALFVSKRDSSIDAGVGTIVDPIFYRSKDPIALDVDTQFYFGEIVVIPTVEQQQQDVEYTDITYYVPYDATWYSFETGKQLQKGWNLHRSNFNSAPFIALNAGSIIVWSDATGVQRTRFLPQEINLIVTLDQNLSATGQFLSIKEYDDKTIESKCWNIIYEYSCLRTVSVVLKKDVLVFTNTAPANDQSEAIIIQNIILYYKETIETFTVKVSSLTKQWQINL